MQLLFLRHGIAQDPVTGMTDEERALTPEGHQQIQLVAQAMRRLAINPGAICSSPLLRCRETAQHVAQIFGQQVIISQELAPGCSFDQLQKLLKHVSADSILLVGHAPDMGHLVAAFLNSESGSIRTGKGSLAAVDCDSRIRRGHGTLRFFLTAGQLAIIGEA